MPRTMQVAIDPRHGLIFLTDQEDQRILWLVTYGAGNQS